MLQLPVFRKFFDDVWPHSRFLRASRLLVRGRSAGTEESCLSAAYRQISMNG